MKKIVLYLIFTLLIVSSTSCSNAVGNGAKSPETTNTNLISKLPEKYVLIFKQDKNMNYFDFSYIINRFAEYKLVDGLKGADSKDYTKDELEGLFQVFSKIPISNPQNTGKVGRSWSITINEKAASENAGISINVDMSSEACLEIAIRDNDELIMGAEFDIPKEQGAALSEAFKTCWDAK